MRRIILLFILLSLAFVTIVFAQDGYKFLIFSENEKLDGPMLIERGWAVKEYPIKFNASKSFYSGTKYLNVSIDKDLFNSMFEFCALSGSSAYNLNSSCEFAESGKNYFFEKIGDTSCTFICKEVVSNKKNIKSSKVK